MIQTGHAACLQFCWLSKLQERGQVWSDVLIDCLGRGIRAQQNKGFCKVKSEDGSEQKRKPHLAYSRVESGMWDVQMRQCAYMRYQTCCSTRLGNNQWMQSQTVLGCKKGRTGHVIDQTAVAEISIYGVKIKDSLSWKSICLLICSYFGESKSVAHQVLYKPNVLWCSWETGFILHSLTVGSMGRMKQSPIPQETQGNTKGGVQTVGRRCGQRTFCVRDGSMHAVHVW